MLKSAFRPELMPWVCCGCAVCTGQKFHGSWSLKPGGGQAGMCMFEDGSFMEEWTLFYNQAGTPRGVDLGTVLRYPSP